MVQVTGVRALQVALLWFIQRPHYHTFQIWVARVVEEYGNVQISNIKRLHHEKFHEDEFLICNLLRLSSFPAIF